MGIEKWAKKRRKRVEDALDFKCKGNFKRKEFLGSRAQLLSLFRSLSSTPSSETTFSQNLDEVLGLAECGLRS